MRAARPCFRPALFCLALLLAGGQAMAVESRHLDANGSGACPDGGGTAAATAQDEADVDTDTAPAPAHRAPKAAKPPAARASGNRGTAPRWHSFLPGLFR